MNDFSYAPPALPQTLVRSNDREWWRSAVIYQIYPRSYFDANNDGTGDLKGITAKIPYLKDLGINGMWVNPFMKSPGKDGFYDAASYDDVDPIFGTNDDMERMIDVAHDHGIKVVFDLVINHTSNLHPWFIRTLSPEMYERRIRSNYDADKDPHANMYVFRPANPDRPDALPNNWLQFFGNEPAWSRASTGEWYLRRFTAEQPDLNPYNALVTRAVFRIAQRWIKNRKIDGIRIDVLDHTYHDKELRDFEPAKGSLGIGHLDKHDWFGRYVLPEALTLAGVISSAIKSANPNAVSIGELHYSERVRDFRHHADFHTKGGIDLPFNFGLQATVLEYGADARRIKDVVERYMQSLPEGACTNFVLNNHDQIARLIDRVGKENIRAITMLLLTLGNANGSSAFIYYGDEIGMSKKNAKNGTDIVGEAEIDDPQGRLRGVNYTRDHSRLPMRWSGNASNGGFSESETTWLPVGHTVHGESDYGHGVEEQMADPHSQLNFTRDIIHLRKQQEAICFGHYVPHDSGDDSVYCFGRKMESQDGQNLFMAFNFSDEAKVIRLPSAGTVVRSTESTKNEERVSRTLTLNPHEGCIIQLESEAFQPQLRPEELTFAK